MAISFLKYTGRDSGNKLERVIFKKLQDPEELCNLKADGLMFYHIYADLVTLAKSTELKKSAFDMNHHFFEIQLLFFATTEASSQKGITSELQSISIRGQVIWQ